MMWIEFSGISREVGSAKAFGRDRWYHWSTHNSQHLREEKRKKEISEQGRKLEFKIKMNLKAVAGEEEEGKRGKVELAGNHFFFFLYSIRNIPRWLIEILEFLTYCSLAWELMDFLSIPGEFSVVPMPVELDICMRSVRLIPKKRPWLIGTGNFRVKHGRPHTNPINQPSSSRRCHKPIVHRVTPSLPPSPTLSLRLTRISDKNLNYL